MAITATNPVTVALPATPPVYDEWRQSRLEQAWNAASGPLSAFVMLRRCRREPLLVDGAQPTDPLTGLPAARLIDMSADEEAQVRQQDPNFSRDVIVDIPDFFAMAADPLTPPEVATLARQLYAVQIALIVAYGQWKGAL